VIRNAGLAAIALLLLGRAFLFGLVHVGTASMLPAVQPGETHFYWKLGTPAPGRIVVFRDPAEPEFLHVKRIVAGPGQAVALKSGRLYVEGVRVGRDLLQEKSWWSTDCQPRKSEGLQETLGEMTWEVLGGGDHDPAVVAEGTWWVLGDNRGNSSDSRHFGSVPGEWIEGVLGWGWGSRNRCGT
jgi:signal peptidase I